MDYELTDYGSAKYYSEEDFEDFSGVNTEVENTYKMAGVLKVGAEIRLNKKFFWRAGYNHFGSPYNKDLGVEQSASLYATGFGFRHRSFCLDGSYQVYSQKLEIGAYAKNMKANTLKITLGYKF